MSLSSFTGSGSIRATVIGRGRLWGTRTIVAALLLMAAPRSQAQTSNIGGVVNRYAAVLAIDTTGCRARLTVASAGTFTVGDTVLLIQMQGARLDTANTSTFGTVRALGGAGSYELARVTSVAGPVVQLNGALLNRYDVRGHVQLVWVATYGDAVVTAPLTCPAWDGRVGGVLVVQARNSLRLRADIDVSGKGFRSGIISNNPDGSCGSGSRLYYYPLTQPGGFWATGGAEKGEGIGSVGADKRAGRGPLGNGGGGGNKHNTGGGGGGNGTAGGIGGNQLMGCALTAIGGIGGGALRSYYPAHLFLGGGGGSGDQNNAVGSTGQPGGGIVLLIAPTIIGGGFAVKANGRDVTVIGSGIADGAGGGGAGGAAFLVAATITPPLTVQASGGTGGSQQPTWGCVGPGGGGGTGVILTSRPNLNGVTTTLTPGAAGRFQNSQFPCHNTTYGAAPGAASLAGPLTGVALVMTPDTPASITSTVVPGPEAELPCGADTLTLRVRPPLPVGTRYAWQYAATTAGPWQPAAAPNAAPTYLAGRAGAYRVVVGMPDCETASTPTTIQLGPTPLVVLPNIITPNGDLLNDCLELPLAAPRTSRLRIYNRWGRLVFSADTPGCCWAADDVAAGVYYYYWTYSTACDPEEYSLKGTVTVIR